MKYRGWLVGGLKMKSIPWYQRYPELRDRVQETTDRFLKRCKQLAVSPEGPLNEFRREVITRAVQESNWQEGIYVEPGKTKELAIHVFERLDGIQGPHLDLDKMLRQYQDVVVKMKEGGASVNEIAACNLSAAHLAMLMMELDFLRRDKARLLKELRKAVKEEKALIDKYRELGIDVPTEYDAHLNRRIKGIEDKLSDATKSSLPLTGRWVTEGEILRELLALEFDQLQYPMSVDHIHFLHRLTLMGIADPKVCGVFRTTAVHVGIPDLHFAPPSMVPQLVSEFCHDFPLYLKEEDPLLKAAEVSYRFVRIHPYVDGNGRISRLLMNFVLLMARPNLLPVYLKADKKGSHRYAQALKRANRRNLEPLACLIAISLIEIYEKLIKAVEKAPRNGV